MKRFLKKTTIIRIPQKHMVNIIKIHFKILLRNIEKFTDETKFQTEIIEIIVRIIRGVITCQTALKIKAGKEKRCQ